MKEVVVVIKYRLSDENFMSEEFQDFLLSIQNGEMKKEMEDGDHFESIKISYHVKDV